MSKYYAIRVGKKPGIYTSWPEAQQQISGFSNAKYKSFTTKAEAEAFMNKPEAVIDKKTLTDSYVEIYVDGSYMQNRTSKAYGSGWVAVKDGAILQQQSFAGDDAKYIESRQIAGEVMACIDAIRWAKNQHYASVIIYYDYQGIERWATKEWGTKTPIAQDYVQVYDQTAVNITVYFKKVPAHTGVEFNEMADQLAKSAAQQHTH